MFATRWLLHFIIYEEVLGSYYYCCSFLATSPSTRMIFDQRKSVLFFEALRFLFWCCRLVGRQCPSEESWKWEQLKLCFSRFFSFFAAINSKFCIFIERLEVIKFSGQKFLHLSLSGFLSPSSTIIVVSYCIPVEIIKVSNRDEQFLILLSQHICILHWVFKRVMEINFLKNVNSFATKRNKSRNWHDSSTNTKKLSGEKWCDNDEM